LQKVHVVPFLFKRMLEEMMDPDGHNFFLYEKLMRMFAVSSFYSHWELYLPFSFNFKLQTVFFFATNRVSNFVHFTHYSFLLPPSSSLCAWNLTSFVSNIIRLCFTKSSLLFVLIFWLTSFWISGIWNHHY